MPTREGYHPAAGPIREACSGPGWRRETARQEEAWRSAGEGGEARSSGGAGVSFSSSSDRVVKQLCLSCIYFILCFRSPVSLAVAAVDAASVQGAAFRRSRLGTIDQDEEVLDVDLGLAGPEHGHGGYGSGIGPDLGQCRDSEGAGRRGAGMVGDAGRQGLCNDGFPATYR